LLLAKHINAPLENCFTNISFYYSFNFSFNTGRLASSFLS